MTLSDHSGIMYSPFLFAIRRDLSQSAGGCSNSSCHTRRALLAIVPAAGDLIGTLYIVLACLTRQLVSVSVAQNYANQVKNTVCR